MDTSRKLGTKMTSNTISNYISLFISIGISLFLTRLLFKGLTRDEYGFWGLLWSIFGYSLLLDFGFGTTIQKATSEVMITKDWKKYNTLVSTVFFTYACMSILIIAVTVVLSLNLHTLFRLDTTGLSYYRTVFLVFGIGTACVFPIGFFTEILRGTLEISKRNIVQSLSLIFNYVFIYYALRFKGNLISLSFITIGLSFMTNLMMAFLSFKKIRELRISLAFFNPQMLKSSMNFSFFAYIITFSNLVIFRTDQLVISVFLSVQFVAVYQIASRISDMFRRFSTQFLDSVGPAASTLNALNDKEGLARIMIVSDRISGFIACLMIIPLAFFLEPLLQIWLDFKDADGTVCAYILLFSMFILVSFRSGSVQVLLMCGHQKILTAVALIECTANLFLSIILLKYWGIIGVAMGTLIPNFILAVAFNIPSGCRFSGLTIIAYMKKTMFNLLPASAVSFAAIYGISRISFPKSLMSVFLNCCLSAMVFIFVYYFTGLTSAEKITIGSILRFRKRGTNV